MQLRTAVASSTAKDIAGEALTVHTGQNWFGCGHVAERKCQVLDLIDRIAKCGADKRAPFGRDLGLRNANK